MIGDPAGLHDREPEDGKIWGKSKFWVGGGGSFSPVFLPPACQPGSQRGASAPHPFYWDCFPCFASCILLLFLTSKNLTEMFYEISVSLSILNSCLWGGQWSSGQNGLLFYPQLLPHSQLLLSTSRPGETSNHCFANLLSTGYSDSNLNIWCTAVNFAYFMIVLFNQNTDNL